MKIGFLGCGAMGSIYAGNLTKAHEVYIFDAMPAVCEAVNTTGITIDEPDGSTRVYHPVIATTDPSTIGILEGAGMGCVGCPASQSESLADACLVHGLNANEVLAKLNGGE